MIAARAFLFILLVLMGLTLAHSEGFTGIDLYKVCADPRADSVCIAYVRGLSEGYYEGLYIGRSLERAHQTASGDPIVGTPGGSEGLGTLQQGMLEDSNVNVVDEFIQMIVTQRAYESNSKVVEAADQMLQDVNNLSH